MFLSLMWIAVAAAMVTIITAAMKVQNTSLCRGYDIAISGAEDGKLFTSEENIAQLLKAATNGNIKGQRINEFDLSKIEDLLEQSAWVYNAELYFDNRNMLRVNVTERKPLARVFTNIGESFYIDEAGKHIPLSEKISLDVPVFTGFPTKKIFNAADSALVQNVIAAASFINNDEFWSSQVSQIAISHQGVKGWQMTMVPVVGNHVAQLGDGSDIAAKFHRLYLFYDQVLKRKGFDKYQNIDVQYTGQVIGIKGNYTKIDSLQLRKNIETLLSQSHDANETISETPGMVPMSMDSSALTATPDVETEPIALIPAESAPVEKPKPATTSPAISPAAKPVKKPEPQKKNIPEVKNDSKKIADKSTVKKEEKKTTTKPEAKKPEVKPAVKKETKADAAKAAAKKQMPAAGQKTTQKKPEAKKPETKKPVPAKPSANSVKKKTN